MSGLPPNPDNHLFWGDWCGWYTPGSCEFGGYLHNPYGYKYLSEPMKSAVDHATNKYSDFPKIDTKLYDMLKHFFGNRKDNEQNGLDVQYDRLHYAIKYNLDVYKQCTELIGLILWGADDSHPEIKISEYTKSDGDTITLTVQSICYTLIKEYIKDENLDSVCLGTIPSGETNVDIA